MKVLRHSLWALVILLWCSVSSAQSLKIATGEWAPITSRKMEGYGEFTRLATIVFKEMGIEPDYCFYPWRRCFDSVEKNRVWAGFPYSYTRERSEKVWFSDPLSCSTTRLFCYTEDAFLPLYDIVRLEDLKPYRIGGVGGYFYEETFKKKGLNVFYTNKELHMVEMLRLGRLDLIPLNERVGRQLISDHFPDHVKHFKTIGPPISLNPLRLIVSKGYPGSAKLLERFNQALRRCLDKGLIPPVLCDPATGILQ